MESKNKKLTKKQLLSLRGYRRKTILALGIIAMISLWFKIGLNTSWHLNDAIVEIITLFILIIAGIISNIKNDFPIFQSRKFQFSKEFSYSVIISICLLFIFIIYKNIVDNNFISYLAQLSVHDLLTTIVFITPIFLLIIYLIYLGFKINKPKKKTKEILSYSDKIERSLNNYRSTTIKIIFLIMSLAIWLKVGLNSQFTFYIISTEIFSIIIIITLWIIGNIDSKLSPFYNCFFKIDKYFFLSILLPYLLILIYTLINRNFRFLILNLDIKELISLLTFMSPLFFLSSIIFYIGCRSPLQISISKKKISAIKKRTIINSIIALTTTLILTLGTFIYCFTKIVTNYNIENILQAIIVFIPISTIIYIILYNEIKIINK